jgi:hypothetical protein
MRVKNKEIRRRRHRKEQTIKAANKAIAQQFAGKSASSPAPKAAAAKPAAKAAPKKAAKKDEA